MRVELLYFDGCPNWRVAEERLNDALRIAGYGDTHVERRLVATPEQADEVGFIGSPTIRIDERDPFALGREPVRLACRVYPTPDGLSGSPTVAQFVGVLS